MPQLNARFPVVRDDRTMEQPFREEMTRLANAVPLIGAGSPEGVLEALQYQTYINTTGSTGSLMYVKKLTDIGGDKTQGWIAV